MKNKNWLLWILILVAASACSLLQTAKPYVSTVDDIAKSMCAKYYGDALGVSVDDAFEMYCRTREAFSPWIDPALASVQAGGAAASQRGDDVSAPPQPPPPKLLPMPEEESK